MKSVVSINSYLATFPVTSRFCHWLVTKKASRLLNHVQNVTGFPSNAYKYIFTREHFVCAQKDIRTGSLKKADFLALDWLEKLEVRAWTRHLFFFQLFKEMRILSTRITRKQIGKSDPFCTMHFVHFLGMQAIMDIAIKLLDKYQRKSRRRKIMIAKKSNQFQSITKLK